DRPGCALEDVQLLRAGGQVWDALDGAGARPDDADPLVGQPRQVAVGRPAGVFEVPTGRVEGAPPEDLHPGDRRQLERLEDAGGYHGVLGPDPVTAIGVTHPVRLPPEPLARRNTSVEQCPLDQIELAGDPL